MGFKALIIFSLMIPVHTQTDADPCSSYKELSNIARNTSFTDSVPCRTVLVPEGWYRFDIDGVGQVATDCPAGNECGTGKKMWINGTLPEVDDDVVLLQACVTSLESSCCSRTQAISVKKCYVGFYVYSIAHLPYCTTVCLNDTNEGLIEISTTRNIESTPGITPMTTTDEYKSSETITTEPEAPKSSFPSAVTLVGSTISVPTQTHGDPCTSYKDLSHIARNTTFADSVPCGSNLVPKRWYRFEDNGIEQVATSCPVGNECGTGNRIWINGIMPGVADGVVSLPACLKSTTSSCCLRAQGINVKKCSSGFFVYEIGNLPPCTTVCLNDTTQDITMSTATTPEDTTTAIDVTSDQTSELAVTRNVTTGGGSSDITDASTEPSTVSLTSHLPTTPSPDTTTTSVKRSTDLSSTLATSTSRTTKRTILTSPTTSSSKGSISSENSSIFSSPTVSLATVASDTEKSEYKASTEFIIATSVGGAVVLMAVGITVCVVKKRRRRW